MLATDLSPQQAYSLLSKTECLFAAIWHNPQGTVETEKISQYYEVPSSTVIEALILHQQEFGEEVQGDDWTPKAALRLGMLLNSPQAARVRSLTLDVVEAQKCKTKRDSITFLLRNSEFVQWSDREISKILQCSPTIVGQARKELESEGKILKFEKRKFNRNGNTIEQSVTKESDSQPSSVHSLDRCTVSNPDSIVELPKATVNKLGDPRDGEECVIVKESDGHWQKLVRFSDGEERAYADIELDSPSVPYTPVEREVTESSPTERRYPPGYQEAIAQLQEQHRQEVARLEADIEARIKAEAEQKAIASAHEQIASYQAIASQKSLEIAKLQQKIDELESLRTLEAENQLLKQRIADLESAMQPRACQEWGNTLTKQAEKVINAEAVKVIETIDPDLDLRQLATTPPPRHRYAEIIQLFEKASDLLDRVPLIGRRVCHQGRYGTIEDIEDDAAEINWDERRAEDSGGDRYPLSAVEVLPTVEGISKGSFVSWASPDSKNYSLWGEVLQVQPRTSTATVRWNNGKIKPYLIAMLRLIRRPQGATA